MGGILNMCKPFEEWPELMTVAQVIEYTGMNSKDVHRIFNLPDFPQVVPGKRSDRIVGKFVLRDWLNKGVKPYEEINS